MRALVVLLFFFTFCPGFVHGQSEQKEVSCSANRGKENRPHKKKLWDGYEVSLGPSRNSVGGGDECTAAIYSRTGRVVYRTTGFNVVFDENGTGEDFDGDGHPEVVFKTDTGGGMHCCWTYNVISLWPHPHKLVDIEAPGAVDFTKDEHDKILIWALRPGPYGYTSMARAPFAQKVFRVGNGKLSDVTPEHCAAILGGDDYNVEKRQLTPERIRQFKAGALSPNWSEIEEMASAVLTVALQHVFCRQFDQAAADLEWWPQDTKSEMKVDFAKAIRLEYPEFASRLLPPK